MILESKDMQGDPLIIDTEDPPEVRLHVTEWGGTSGVYVHGQPLRCRRAELIIDGGGMTTLRLTVLGRRVQPFTIEGKLTEICMVGKEDDA